MSIRRRAYGWVQLLEIPALSLVHTQPSRHSCHPQMGKVGAGGATHPLWCLGRPTVAERTGHGNVQSPSHTYARTHTRAHHGSACRCSIGLSHPRSFTMFTQTGTSTNQTTSTTISDKQIREGQSKTPTGGYRAQIAPYCCRHERSITSIDFCHKNHGPATVPKGLGGAGAGWRW
jgi:hypothetical protein